MAQEPPEKIKPKGKPLNLEELEKKADEFTPLEIRRAIRESGQKLKSYLEAKNQTH
jgi:hypothetical protein